MTLPRTILGAALSSVIVVFASSASAQITGARVDKLPIAYVDRPLTLPENTLSAELDLTIHHFESGFFDATGSTLDIWGAFGIGEDIEIETVLLSVATEDFAVLPMSPLELISEADWGTWRIGATVRFIAQESFEMGGRFRFLVDNNATIGFNGGLPIIFRAPKFFRLDTGLAFMGLVSADTGNGAFGLFDVSSNPSAPGPGIPLRFTFNPIEFLFLGFSSGFGVLDVEQDESIFIPLGFHLGGSIDTEPVLIDLMATAGFPLFALPAEDTTEERVLSELWQIGLSAEVHYNVSN